MGKEQELLDAARNGNIPLIHKLLAQKPRKPGALHAALESTWLNIGFRRGPNASCQDINGSTPLHLAALNGHRDAVEVLLQYEASANIMDSKGCCPLHLAAWSGNADICQILLTKGPSIAKVNQQNYDGETALHCAAQYGHVAPVTVLIQGHADPATRNKRDETPLDLAAQYGRLEVVQLLLNKHRNLLNEVSSKHSPLHLACRNGHKNVVKVLLREGFEPNTKAETGTALHEAALFGKLEVVKILLRAGIDTELKDGTGRTALEVLQVLSTPLADDIRKVIVEFNENRHSFRVQRDSSDLLGFDSGDSDIDDDAYDCVPQPRPLAPPVDKEEKHPKLSQFEDQLPEIITEEELKVKQREFIFKGKEARDFENRDVRATYHAPVSKRISNGGDDDSDDEPLYDVPPPMHHVSKARSTSELNEDLSNRSLSPSQISEISCSSLEVSPRDGARNSPVPPKKPPRRKKGKSTDTHSVAGWPISYMTGAPRNSPEPSNKSDWLDRLGKSPRENSLGHMSECPRDSLPGASPDTEDKLNNNKKGKSANVDISITITDNDHNQIADHSKHAIINREGSSSPSISENSSVQKQQIGSVSGVLSQQTHLNSPKRGSADVVVATENTKPQSEEDINVLVMPQEAESMKPNPAPADVTSTVITEHILISNKLPCAMDNETSAETENTNSLLEKDTGIPVEVGLRPKPVAVPRMVKKVKKDSEKPREEQPLSPPSDGEENKSSRPPSLDLDSNAKRKSQESQPLSPTGYQQPPTPDHPPPSPSTAGLSIKERINPQEKRRSRDMETITEAEYLETFQTEDNQQVLVQSTDDKVKDPPHEGSTGQEKSKCILRRPPGGAANQPEEETSLSSAEDPFLGLTRGSIPAGRRRVKSQIFENLFIQAGGLSKHKLKRLSYPGIVFNFDPPDERDEQGKESGEDRHSGGIMTTEKQDGESTTSKNETPGGDTDGDQGSKVTASHEGHTEVNMLDDSDEWAQVAGILSSFGGRMSTTEYSDRDFEKRLQEIFAKEKQKDLADQKVHSVGAWLENLELGQYENILIANGFDDLDFMGPDVLEEQDLIEIGIGNEEHRQRIIEAASKLTPLKEQDIGQPETVDDWLACLQLSDYSDTFQSHNFDNLERIKNIWDLELNTVLDITTLGHRKRILASLAGHRTHSSEEDLKKAIETSLQRGAFGAPEDNGENVSSDGASSQAGLNLYRDYTALHSQCRESLTPPNTPINGTFMYDTDTVSQAEDSPKSPVHDGALDIRPPNYAQQKSPVTQWKHKPEVLIKGCSYSAQYLGSTLVRELKGTQSTEEAIRKIKESTDVIAKTPTVTLSISYAGVKFIDSKSKRVICEHEISNIFCACQDADHLNFFAYITKDLQTRKHYCHVFSVRTMNLATEIILTLGEAFEVAYQMALREQELHEAAANLQQSGVSSDDTS